MGKTSRYFQAFLAIVFLALLIYNLAPFFWMISSSLKTDFEVKQYPPTILPTEPTIGAYYRIWWQESFVSYFLNSLIVSLSTAVLSTLVGSLAGYGFSRYEFPGRIPLMTVFLGSQLLPGVLLVGPYFKMLSATGLYDTRIGLIIAQTTITLPFSIWMLKGFIDSVPVEIDQQALVDGANRWGAFVRVVLPNIAPGMVATIIFAFLLAWGDLLWALVIISTKSLQTVTLGVTQLVGQFRVQWSEIMAASVIASVPPVVLYLILQKYLIKGFTAGAVKE